MYFGSIHYQGKMLFNCYRYPRPGPRREPWHLKYFMYGFVYIQDMIEHAIIKLHTGVGDIKSGVGIFTQQFPYPCYTEDK